MPAPVADSDRFEQVRRLTEVSRALTYATSLEAVLRLTVERAVELLAAKQAVLMLEDEDGLLHIRAAHGVDEDLVQRFHEPLDEGLIKRLQGIFGPIEADCFLGVPLVAQGEVTGMLAVVRASGDPCTETDEWLLSALADQAAVALENTRLSSDVRRELEERLEAMQGATDSKERALSTLGHELRTPLNAIDAYAQLLEMGMLGPVTDRQREALGRIQMSGRHLLAVLENVLEMARLNAGVLRVRPSRVAARKVVKEAAQLLMPSASEKGQSLSVHAAPELWVRADPARLRQVLANLLGNAVKYSPTGGAIRISASARQRGGKPWCYITVTDAGPGIPRDQVAHIFEPYYRVAATEAEAGAGLGLAISSELVRQMGGVIEVESEPGQGATFTVRLPFWTDPVGKPPRDDDSGPG